MGEAPVRQAPAAHAFGVERPPASHRAVRWLRGSDRTTPKSVDRWVGGTIGLIVWATTLHSPFAFLIVPAGSYVPSWALERFYRARRRRQEERLLPPS